MDLYSGIDANGNLESTSYDWHHDDQKNELNAQNATNALNVSLAKYQNDWNLQQWQREMDWNAPANQLRLLQEAGLNPNIFGQGLAGNMRTQAPQSADMSVAGNFYQSQEQAKMANVASLLASFGDQVGGLYDKVLQQKQLGLASDRLELDRQEAKSRIILNNAKSDETKASTRSLLKGLEVSDANIRMIEQKIGESQYYCKVLDQDFRNGKVQADFLEKTFSTRVAREGLQNRLMSEQIGLTKEQAGLATQQILNEIQKIKLTKEQVTGQQIQNAIQQWTQDHLDELHINDIEKAHALGNLYGFINDMLGGDELREEARKPFRPSSRPKYDPDAYSGDVITYPQDNMSRSSRNP